jgi:hypothetical protein
MLDVIENIRFKLGQLSKADTNFEVFGSPTHKYQLNPVVRIDEINRFENLYKIKLPEPFRGFLTTLGNGGAGPSYGLFPLGIMDDGFDMSAWDDDFVKPSEKFRFTESYNDTSMLDRGAPKESDFNSTQEYESAYDTWSDENFEELQMEYWQKHALDGAIPICHHGCAYRSWLVVAEGIEYGNIWHDDTPDESGVHPELDCNNNRIDFGSWYLSWLDKSIKEITDKNA